ncbi:MAG: alpha-1,4-glucan--maltose-1-phosphate maltosyltransferase [Oscillochloris sp.]|nr:alpha-1,4-glucan--maltose-1-phosphate maltosyltransferase [Oscillochloris sp.]
MPPAIANIDRTSRETKYSRNGFEAIGEGRSRVIIAGVSPAIDGGRYPIKRVIGDEVTIECDSYSDGHDVQNCAIVYRHSDEHQWREAPMEFIVNDRYRGSFIVDRIGTFEYSVIGWIDRFATWEHQLHKRVEANQELRVELLIGAELVAEAAEHAPEAAAATLRGYEEQLRAGDHEPAFAPELAQLMAAHLPRRFASRYDPDLKITVDRPLARFSSWYELFPRSAGAEPGRHGTFRDVIARLPYVQELGFNILYLPPIHPIGRAFRKGKNNSTVAGPDDPGSPWAIGGPEGGHKSIHPELGTLEDFHALVAAARAHGLEIALDIAFQCAPDHPYVKAHPEWFRARPDGTIQYAENPPKKYQDIYPFDFETSDWQAMWIELKSIFDYWIDQGVTVFRVDNPHTKAFDFWEWCIGSIKAEHPEVIFLAEAFTRPKMMYSLAKKGFTQGYTYFTWRTAKWELIQYLTELTQTQVYEFFGPNFWPNTPDILTPQFYPGHRATFQARAALAATMTASWGMYGPLYELIEHIPVQGREEYNNSEKYEIRNWNLDDPKSLRRFIADLNKARNENPALQRNDTLRFHRIDNNFAESDQLIAYSKTSLDKRNIILVVVNLDPGRTQSGWLQIPLAEWGLDDQFQVHDLLTDVRYTWQDEFNYVELNPHMSPVHVFAVCRRVRDERGFEYFA